MRKDPKAKSLPSQEERKHNQLISGRIRVSKTGYMEDVLKAFSNPARRRIIALLSSSKPPGKTVRDIADDVEVFRQDILQTKRVSCSLVAARKHLRMLERIGVVEKSAETGNKSAPVYFMLVPRRLETIAKQLTDFIFMVIPPHSYKRKTTASIRRVRAGVPVAYACGDLRTDGLHYTGIQVHVGYRAEVELKQWMKSVQTQKHERPWLVIDDGMHLSREYTIYKDYIWIGRDKSNDVVIQDEYAAGRHALIFKPRNNDLPLKVEDSDVTVKSYVIEDLGSQWGTIVWYQYPCLLPHRAYLMRTRALECLPIYDRTSFMIGRTWFRFFEPQPMLQGEADAS